MLQCRVKKAGLTARSTDSSARMFTLVEARDQAAPGTAWAHAQVALVPGDFHYFPPSGSSLEPTPTVGS